MAVPSKKDLKRQRVLDAAKRRFGRFGLRATTMQDIATEAGVAVGTIYQFFPDKNSLILAWVEEHRQLLHAQYAEVLKSPRPAGEKLKEFLNLRFAVIEQIREEPAIAELTRTVHQLTPEAVPEMTRTVIQQLQSILEEGRRGKQFPSVKPARDSMILFHALTGFFAAVEDPLTGPPSKVLMLQLVDWFIEKWKLPRPAAGSKP